MSVRFVTVFPLAALTAVGLLATDLYLPAVPALPSQLDGSIAAAQATLAAFMAALALSQLLWGVAVDHYGSRRVLAVALVLQVGAGTVCALAGSFPVLIAARAVQGLGVGAATVVVATMIRQRFAEEDLVRAMSWLGIAESLVPALGPVAGAVLLSFAGWQTCFWIVTAVAAALGPFALRLAPVAAPNVASSGHRGYVELLRTPSYLGYALGHALCFAALLAFVASAPQLVRQWLASGPMTFAVLQACGVAAFIACAAQSGRLTARFGIDRLIRTGVVLQVASALAFLAQAVAGWRSVVALVATWALFCGALGLRGPATMARALAIDAALVGRATGLMMFLALGLSALGTQAVAPFLTGGLMPVALMSLAFTGASAAVIGWGMSRPRVLPEPA